MVAFASAEPGSVEAWNRQIGSMEFLPSAYHFAFDQLVGDIRRLARDTDELTLPSANEAGAWSSAYSIYEKLKERQLKAEQSAHERNQPLRQQSASGLGGCGREVGECSFLVACVEP
jgi:hypothetical protein